MEIKFHLTEKEKKTPRNIRKFCCQKILEIYGNTFNSVVYVSEEHY